MARPPGIPNRSTMRAELTCQLRNFNSIDAMIDGAQLALTRFHEELELMGQGRLSPMESKAAEFLGLYIKAADKIAQYVHPKRKSVERIETDALKDMSPVQRLEAMKQAVAMLELQLKKDGS